MRIKLVLFDAFDTIVTPRHPVWVQYAQVFSPYFALDPADIKLSFKTAIKQVQKEQPAYSSQSTSFKRPSDAWWGEVIKRTAVGAGADPKIVENSLPHIVPKMVHRFSTREGYTLFEDTIPTLELLRERGIKTGIVSNTDSTMRLVLADLGAASFLSLTVLSAEEGVEKPSRAIYECALRHAGVDRSETIHVGDDIDSDYRGARAAGLTALLLRRPGREEEEQEEIIEHTIASLTEVVSFVDKMNGFVDG